jgi:tyrosine-protein kinase Etk/Wzc
MMEKDEINLADILDTLYFQRYLIAIVTAFFAAGGLLYIVIATPIYRTNLLIQIEAHENATPSALSDLSTLFGGKSEADAEMQILGSRLVVSKAVDNLHLDFDANPRYFPLIGEWIAKHNNSLSSPGLFGMGGYAWGSEAIDVGLFTVPETWMDKVLTLVADGDNKFRVMPEGSDKEFKGEVGKPLEIALEDGTIELRVDNLVANPGTDFILVHHSHLKAITDLQKDLDIAEKVKQSDILNVSLEGDDPRKIADILNEIGTQYVLQNIQQKSAEAEKTLHFLGQFLPSLKKKLNAAESRYITMSAARGTVDMAEETKAVLKRLVDAKTKLGELKAKRDELLSRYTPAHPAVQAIDAQISGIEAEIGTINSEIRKMPGVERDVLSLNRDVKIDSDLYTSLLSTAQQLQLLKEGSVGNVRIIDNAVVPERPVKPKRLLVLVLFLMVGLMLGAIAAFIKRRMSGAIFDAHEIEEQTGLKVYASIPHSEKQRALFEKIHAGEAGRFVLENLDTYDPAIESLRSFRTALQYSMLEAKNHLVMITGATPGVGKSFVSVNLAGVLAAAGKRVLLVDLDLRKGYLNQYFGLPRERGITEVADGKLSFDQAVYRNVLPNLDFISTGTLPEDPNAFLLHEDLPSLLERISGEFDIVLFDTPPVLAVTDATVLSAQVAINILVAREGVTTLGEINESIKRLSQAGTGISGVVFNGVRPRPGYAYGYGNYRYSSHAYEQYTQGK